jgi:hypothetical protein
LESQKGLEVLSNTADFTYTSHEVGGETLTLTVTDNENNKVSDTIYFDVRETDSADCASKTDIYTRRTIIKENIYGLTFTEFLLADSSMSYCPDKVDELGATFKFNFNDPAERQASGAAADGYPNGMIGGMQDGNTWNIGDKSKTGMPVRLSKIGQEEKIIVEWKVSQEEAYDADDKWHATINCIFGTTKDTKPSAKDRDYDLVIQSDSHNTEDGFYDDDNKGENNETRAH